MKHWTQGDVPPPTFAAAAGPAIDLTMSLATPMLGGGVRSGMPDVEEPFRPTAVRNGIRFWWRRVWLAVRPRATIAELAAAEAAAWGSTERPGNVVVAVESHTDEQPVRVDLWPAGNSVKYAWGVLDNPTSRGSNPLVLPGASGALRVWFPIDGATAQTMRIAVWLWLTFGGVGARTRRGFGLLDHNWELGEVDRGLLNRLFGCPPNSNLAGLGGGKLLTHGNPSPAITAWAASLRPYMDFRKGNLPGAGHRDYDGPGSHSRWPESDAVRIAQLRPPVTHGPAAANRAPRAALGLPLTLHSVDRGATQFADVTIEYGEGGRWPSPVITRPVKSGNGWLPCILILRGPRPARSQVKLGTINPDLDSTNWPTEWFAHGGFGPWPHGKASAVDAFTEYLTQKAHWQDYRP